MLGVVFLGFIAGLFTTMLGGVFALMFLLSKNL